MKNLLILAIAAVVVVGLMSCKGAKGVTEKMPKKPVPTGKLVSFHYAHYGTMAQPNYEYTLNRIDNKVTLCVFRPWIDEGWGDTIKVKDEVIDHVERLIKDNNLQNYLDHDHPEYQVLDGYGWGYEAEFDDDTVLSSSGSNARPADNTLEVIGRYLDSCYAQVKGIKLDL